MRALITGATSGIGKEMAIYLHHMGWKLVLTGRNERILRQMAERFGNDTRYIALDLATPGAAEQLHLFCRDLRVDFLINNAGFGVFGPFTDTSLAEELEMIEVNIRSLHILTKLFLQDFEKRNRGCILNVASSAGFMTGPLMATYYASKNYVVRLTLAIHEELLRAKSDVHVCVLCPGPVDTNFNDRAGVRFGVPAATARDTARYGIDHALEGETVIVPSLPMRLSLLGAKLCPDGLLASVVYHLQKRKVQ